MIKLIITGTAETTQPFPEIEGAQYWGFPKNLSQSEIKKLDVIFELHKKEVLDQNIKRYNMQDFDGVIYTQRKYWGKNLKNGKEFPLEQLTEKFGHYFTSTIAFMLGLAYIQNVSEIWFHRVTMGRDIEYAHQVPCCEYMLGRLNDAGVEVHLEPDSEIKNSTYLYAYEEPPVSKAKIKSRIKYAEMQMKKCEQICRQQKSIMDQLQTALKALDFVQEGNDIQALKEDLTKQLQTASNVLRDAENNFYRLGGARDANLYWKRVLI